MGWLRFDLPLEDELEVEKAIRRIRSSGDVENLRGLAEKTYRAWVTQCDITHQLLVQLAEAEQKLAHYEPVDPKFMEWAKEISAQLQPEPRAAGPWRALRSWWSRR